MSKSNEQTVKHQLQYDMHSCKVSWCPICNQHFYNERNKEHTTLATPEHYHEIAAALPSPAQGVVEQTAEGKFQEALKDFVEGSTYYPLFKFFNEEHNLILLDSEIQEIIHQVKKLPSVEPEKEKILCAATWYKDTPDAKIQVNGVDKGVVLCGFRHGHILHQFNALTGKRSVTTECGEYVQGFLTTKNRFVDRKEALKIAHFNNQIIHSVQLDSHVGLTSEDIY